MIIGQIKDGIVLDHITAGKGMEIYNLLELHKLDCSVVCCDVLSVVSLVAEDFESVVDCEPS